MSTNGTTSVIDPAFIKSHWNEIVKHVGAEVGWRLAQCEAVSIEWKEGILCVTISAKPGYESVAVSLNNVDALVKIAVAASTVLEAHPGIADGEVPTAFFWSEERSCELAIQTVQPSDLVQERCQSDPHWNALVKTTQMALSSSAEHGFSSQTAAAGMAAQMISFLAHYRQPFEIVSLVSCDYGLYLKTDHWQTKREDALAFWGRRCSVCNSCESLDVHHRTYERRGREESTDLIVLCRTCHRIFHDNGRLAKPGR